MDEPVELDPLSALAVIKALAEREMNLRDALRNLASEWEAVDVWGAGTTGKGAQFAEQLRSILETAR